MNNCCNAYRFYIFTLFKSHRYPIFIWKYKFKVVAPNSTLMAYPYQTNNVVSLEGSLPYMGVVSAAVSPNGKEIIVKTYTGLYHYQKKPGESLAQALQKPFTKLHYTIEPQGEAICFAQDDSGFFTLSEKGFSSSVNVYFYKRN